MSTLHQSSWESSCMENWESDTTDAIYSSEHLEKRGLTNVWEAIQMNIRTGLSIISENNDEEVCISQSDLLPLTVSVTFRVLQDDNASTNQFKFVLCYE